MGTPSDASWTGLSRLPKYKSLLSHLDQSDEPSPGHQQGANATANRGLPTGVRSSGKLLLQRYPARPLHRVVSRLTKSPHAEQLAIDLLQLEPCKRISAASAMRSSYFSSALPTAELACLPDTISVLSIPSIQLQPESVNGRQVSKRHDNRYDEPDSSLYYSTDSDDDEMDSNELIRRKLTCPLPSGKAYTNQQQLDQLTKSIDEAAAIQKLPRWCKSPILQTKRPSKNITSGTSRPRVPSPPPKNALSSNKATTNGSAKVNTSFQSTRILQEHQKLSYSPPTPANNATFKLYAQRGFESAEPVLLAQPSQSQSEGLGDGDTTNKFLPADFDKPAKVDNQPVNRSSQQQPPPPPFLDPLPANHMDYYPYYYTYNPYFQHHPGPPPPQVTSLATSSTSTTLHRHHQHDSGQRRSAQAAAAAAMAAAAAAAAAAASICPGSPDSPHIPPPPIVNNHGSVDMSDQTTDLSSSMLLNDHSVGGAPVANRRSSLPDERCYHPGGGNNNPPPPGYSYAYLVSPAGVRTTLVPASGTANPPPPPYNYFCYNPYYYYYCYNQHHQLPPLPAPPSFYTLPPGINNDSVSHRKSWSNQFDYGAPLLPPSSTTMHPTGDQSVVGRSDLQQHHSPPTNTGESSSLWGSPERANACQDESLWSNSHLPPALAPRATSSNRPMMQQQPSLQNPIASADRRDSLPSSIANRVPSQRPRPTNHQGPPPPPPHRTAALRPRPDSQSYLNPSLFWSPPALRPNNATNQQAYRYYCPPQPQQLYEPIRPPYGGGNDPSQAHYRLRDQHTPTGDVDDSTSAYYHHHPGSDPRLLIHSDPYGFSPSPPIIRPNMPYHHQHNHSIDESIIRGGGGGEGSPNIASTHHRPMPRSMSFTTPDSMQLMTDIPNASVDHYNLYRQLEDLIHHQQNSGGKPDYHYEAPPNRLPRSQAYYPTNRITSSLAAAAAASDPSWHDAMMMDESMSLDSSPPSSPGVQQTPIQLDDVLRHHPPQQLPNPPTPFFCSHSSNPKASDGNNGA